MTKTDYILHYMLSFQYKYVLITILNVHFLLKVIKYFYWEIWCMIFSFSVPLFFFPTIPIELFFFRLPIILLAPVSKRSVTNVYGAEKRYLKRTLSGAPTHVHARWSERPSPLTSRIHLYLKWNEYRRGREVPVRAMTPRARSSKRIQKKEIV